MTEEEVIAKLKRIEGVSEVYRVVASYGITRKSKKGTTQTVRVEILDWGENAKDLRYQCNATANDGASAIGNQAPSIHFALSAVHWEHLDLDPI